MADRPPFAYTLLLSNEQKCKHCLEPACYILLGIENELIGFYCKPHGEEKHLILEIKYSFEKENKPIETRRPARKRRRKGEIIIKERTVRICPGCKEEFKATRANKIYCSSKCRFSAWDEKNPRTNMNDE